MEKQKTKTPMKKKVILTLSAILLVVVTFTAAYFLFYKANKPTDPNGIEFEDNATMGIMPGVDLDQRLKELQDELDKGMIAFSVNTNPVFASGTSEGNLMLENPGNNAKLLVARVVINNTNETVYTSKYIKPGSYIENIKLDKVLDAGTYDATVYFQAYTEDDAEYIGETGASITILVQN